MSTREHRTVLREDDAARGLPASPLPSTGACERQGELRPSSPPLVHLRTRTHPVACDHVPRKENA